MAPIPPPSNLPPGTTTEPITAHRLTSYTTTPFATVIQRFRTLVPQVDLRNLRSQTSAEGIRNVIESTLKQSDAHFGDYQKQFVLFYELNHSHWIRHFNTEPTASTLSSHIIGELSKNPSAENVRHRGRGLIRFIFGNPLIAAGILKEDVEAGLHVPVECMFVETGEKNVAGTKMVVIMPGGLIARDRNEETSETEGETLRLKVAELEAKILKLVEELMK
ncbi:hypothetical protein SLS64_009210 [Diaporthe eres]|uniref:Uncharacterized protein n=1 Tax=Diaporthe eres TaxID=83184 RepID=A0ABR1NWE3_DIAER